MSVRQVWERHPTEEKNKNGPLVQLVMRVMRVACDVGKRRAADIHRLNQSVILTLTAVVNECQRHCGM